MHLKFRAFKATNEPDTCLRFMQGHQNVLKEYGITNITSNTDSWMHHPGMYCVVAEAFDNSAILGGVRIQVSDERNKLPVELAIGKMDDRIYGIVKHYRENGGVGELCALWNSKLVAGMGISILLTRAGISVSNQTGVKTLMGICADYTLKMFKKVGFQVDYSLGINGEFAYPNADYTARVLGIMNAESLENAEAYDKERMQSLRNTPIQQHHENETGTGITIDYDLQMKL